MNASKIDLSFIIPAYNEEKNISKTLEMIRKHVPSNLTYEVIVMNHASSDNTAFLAKESGAKVVSLEGGTVANLRNNGADKALGTIFIFLDADIRLTQEWGKNINAIIEKLNSGKRMLTGSWVSISENENWIEKYWFEPQQKKSNTHINSGHMIIGRDQFYLLGGFNGD